jgi:hypothetical protein
MGWHGWNRIFAISLCLAAAGGLACLAALYNIVVPRGSFVAFLAATVPLGIAVVGVLLGFIWLCEQCEDYLSRRAERRFGAEPDKRQRTNRTELRLREDEYERRSPRGISLPRIAKDGRVDGDGRAASPEPPDGVPADRTAEAKRRHAS